MAQKFNDGQTFGQIREILNSNADELNSTTATADEAYKEAGLAMGQANAASNAAGEAKTAATEAKADATEALRIANNAYSIANITETYTRFGGSEVSLESTNDADFTKALNDNKFFPEASRTIVLTPLNGDNIRVFLPQLYPALDATYSALRFRTIVFGTISKMSIGLPSGMIISSCSDFQLAFGGVNWENSATFKIAKATYGVSPGGLEVDISIVLRSAERRFFYDVNIRPLFTSPIIIPMASAAALSTDSDKSAASILNTDDDGRWRTGTVVSEHPHEETSAIAVYGDEAEASPDVTAQDETRAETTNITESEEAATLTPEEAGAAGAAGKEATDAE